MRRSRLTMYLLSLFLSSCASHEMRPYPYINHQSPDFSLINSSENIDFSRELDRRLSAAISLQQPLTPGMGEPRMDMNMNTDTDMDTNMDVNMLSKTMFSINGEMKLTCHGSLCEGRTAQGSAQFAINLDQNSLTITADRLADTTGTMLVRTSIHRRIEHESIDIRANAQGVLTVDGISYQLDEQSALVLSTGLPQQRQDAISGEVELARQNDNTYLIGGFTDSP